MKLPVSKKITAERAADPVEKRAFARKLLALGCLLPILNCISAAALGALVVYSDADTYKVLAGVLSFTNVGGWLWWLAGSVGHLGESIRKWSEQPQPRHPGFFLAGLASVSGALCWVGVLFLLAYGMLG